MKPKVNIKSDGELKLTVTPEIEKVLIDGFNIEIEILQGSRKVLKNGMVKIRATICDPKKQELIKTFLLRYIANHESPFNPN